MLDFSERGHVGGRCMARIVFSNGVYEGGVDEAGMPDGMGKLAYSDGSVYDGQWFSGLSLRRDADTQADPTFREDHRPRRVPLHQRRRLRGHVSRV